MCLHIAPWCARGPEKATVGAPRVRTDETSALEADLFEDMALEGRTALPFTLTYRRYGAERTKLPPSKPTYSRICRWRGEPLDPLS